MSQSATDSLRYAGLKARELLLPFGMGKWVAIYLRVSRGRGDDPVAGELLRLRNYYKGTRLLAKAGLAFVLLGFLLPFTVVFTGMEGFFILLAIYVLFLILLSGASVVLEMVLDPVFALQYEEKSTLGKETGHFLSIARKKPLLVGSYMGIKLFIDMFLMNAILALFFPMLVVAMKLMLYLLEAVPQGVDVRQTAYAGMAGIVILTLLGLLATALVIVFASAFYGYYTEHAVRQMRE